MRSRRGRGARPPPPDGPRRETGETCGLDSGPPAPFLAPACGRGRIAPPRHDRAAAPDLRQRRLRGELHGPHRGRPHADLRGDGGGQLRPRRAVHARRVLRRVRVRGPGVPLLPRGDDRARLRRGARDPDGARPVPAGARQPPGRAHRLHRPAAHAPGRDRHGFRGADGAHHRAATDDVPAFRAGGGGRRRPAALRHHRGGRRARVALGVPSPDPLRMGASGLRAGSGGGGAAGDVDQPDGPARHVHRGGHGRGWRGRSRRPSCAPTRTWGIR